MSLKVGNHHSSVPVTTQDKHVKVAIVGGGIAGLALAIGLQKYPHINVHIYESAHKFGEVGAGVVFGPNAQRAMSLIDPHILEGYNRRCAYDSNPPDEDGLYTWTKIAKGKQPDLHTTVAEFKHKTRGSTVHRAHFLEELTKLLEPGQVSFGKRLDHIYETDDKEAPVYLHFRDGSTAFADVVVGADGVHSAVRKHVLGPDSMAASAFFTGTVQYRATVPMETAEAKLGEREQSLSLLCGENGGVFGLPLSNHTLHYISVTVFDAGIPPSEEVWVGQANLDQVKAHYQDWDDSARQLVELLPEDGSTMAWSVWEMPPAPTYFKDKVVLVGDAAHASTPFQGAGAGQGIEDVLILEKLLGKYLDPAHRSRAMPTAAQTVPSILQSYDAVRRFRSQKVVTTSRETGRLICCLDPVGGNTADSLVKALDGRQNWIWDHDQEGSVKDAYQIFDEIKDAAERQLMRLGK